MSLRAGIEMAPYLTFAGLGLLMICNPLYSAMTAIMPLVHVQPVLHRTLSI